MYLRTTARVNKDGSVVRYLALAHNERVGATTKANVLLSLGREDRLDLDGLRRLVRSINRYLGDTDTAADGLRPIASRPAGAAWLLHGLWKDLGIDTALRTVLGRRRFTTDMERVLFALVAARAIAPASTPAAAEWASHDVAIPGLNIMDEDQVLRAMDLLATADTDARVQEVVFSAVAGLLDLEADLVFFGTTDIRPGRDTTTDAGPVDDADQDREEADTGSWEFRRHVRPPDRPRDRDRIVIGLAVTREGIPVRCWHWPGDADDQAILSRAEDGLHRRRPGRFVTVADRVRSSREDHSSPRRAGRHHIVGGRVRDGDPHAAAALSRQGRYQQIRDDLRVKEVAMAATPGVRWIVCHDLEEGERDAARREAGVSWARTELDQIAAARARAREQARVRRASPFPGTTATARRRTEHQAGRDEAEHVEAEVALREHPTLGQWLRRTPSGRLALNRTAITAAARLDGRFLLSTSDPDLSAEDVALGYTNLLRARRGLRDLTSTIEPGPAVHGTEPSVHAQVVLCWLALLLIRVAERRTGRSWPHIHRELDRLHAVTLRGSAGTVVRTTDLTTEQSNILRACGLAPPPNVTPDPA